MPTINEQVLPPGAICWTRQLKGEFKAQSKKVGMILGHDGTDEDGASACERTVARPWPLLRTPERLLRSLEAQLGGSPWPGQLAPGRSKDEGVAARPGQASTTTSRSTRTARSSGSPSPT